MRFVKYHGLGNDFIVLLDRALIASADLARALCARGFGIGADGVMVAAPARMAGADLAMDLVNSDGSLPEMCGNGIRCFVKYAVDRLGHRQNPLRVETPAGLRACAWTADADGRVATVTVEMGPARFDADELVVDLGDRAFVGTSLNTGNPHYVVFGASQAAAADGPPLAARELALRYGPRLEVHPAFPEKANIEMADVAGPDHLRVTVWERGCGLTWACGTGATATAAAAARRGLAPTGRPVRVSLPGGDLAITIAPDFSASWMEGPATEVFEGTWLGPVA
ncbi:MAG: diaminopimelate epimerase [Myxococcota bacterium]